MEEKDLELKQLGHFTGTQKYVNVMGVNVTDGVEYIMENGYSWFVTDSIAVIKSELKDEEFLSISLKLKDNTGEMIITDGNNKILYTQQYKYTDAKRDIKLFYCDNILMLNNEY